MAKPRAGYCNDRTLPGCNRSGFRVYQMMPKTDPASYPGRVIPGPQCPGTVWVRTGQVFSPPLTTRGYVVTYPNMMDCLRVLGLIWRISDMSFSLSLDKGQGCEWGSRNGLSSCTVVCGDGSREFYNSCVMALHAPDALKILGNQATFDETRTGGAFHDIFLHCDKNSMPQNPAAWSAWSFLGSLDSKNLGETSLPYLVTLNPDHAPEHTLLKWSTGPPVPFVAASKASLELGHIQGRRGIWFRGAYQGYGFHEDGLKDLSINSCMTYGEECFFPGRHDRGACLLEERGTMFTFEGTRKNNHLKTVLRIHSPQFYWKILIANRDLDSSVSRLNQKRGWWSPILFTAGFASAKYFFRHISRTNTLTQACRHISRHYDLSNELFCLFLDESLTYSCALFKRTGCKYTGITLAEKQLKYAGIKVKEADLERNDRSFGHEYMEEFFGCCESLIAKDGLFVLQFISIPDERYNEFRLSSDFMKEYIFPGGCLPSLSRITSAMSAASRLWYNLAVSTV
ncbi:hypothetical protein CUMW_098820 [Citrus unshiu]|uniref:Uncharacterized protein n=1 Tax=Citrus unshiu TaxID=55188 RepID=A0A2H5P2R0_CITUN|nr:hypothetical protein CUMW_098820 [Citrus unshiu]